jgi:NADPH:quinone reductase-like Zn-dependent oxidoreductase
MSSDEPTMQQAWVMETKGLPRDVLKKREWPMPGKLEKGQVLLKVQAAALNPVCVSIFYVPIL